MIEIRVPAPLKAIYVLQFHATTLGGKCKTCLQKAKQKKEE